MARCRRKIVEAIQAGDAEAASLFELIIRLYATGGLLAIRSDLLDRGSCRLLNVNPETYLNWMLSKLAVATTKDVMALLPHDRLALTRL